MKKKQSPLFLCAAPVSFGKVTHEQKQEVEKFGLAIYSWDVLITKRADKQAVENEVAAEKTKRQAVEDEVASEKTKRQAVEDEVAVGKVRMQAMESALLCLLQGQGRKLPSDVATWMSALEGQNRK
ncbi:hypothetical protein Ahy_A09g045308 isoform B [Arachis hypogaea]|uniref:Uncharacterized protein n=1 Tax=Arachis hypogaea TaxID=3818 RepID=A0A445BM23_ARAHY|nr:hypothetical protein Ahy_A09g045308 isoform B [Arachis hypogaea]